MKQYGYMSAFIKCIFNLFHLSISLTITEAGALFLISLFLMIIFLMVKVPKFIMHLFHRITAFVPLNQLLFKFFCQWPNFSAR